MKTPLAGGGPEESLFQGGRPERSAGPIAAREFDGTGSPQFAK
jgi:hypothetical protein